MEDSVPPLQQGQLEVAWDRFLARYRRLIFASIRHYTQDYDDGKDLSAHVCEKLRADGCDACACAPRTPSTREILDLAGGCRPHLLVDWFRHRDGRQRLESRHGAPATRARIVDLIFIERRGHAETDEVAPLR